MSFNSPETLELSSQSCCKLIINLNHDGVFVVVDVGEKMNERHVSGTHCDHFHLEQSRFSKSGDKA